MHYSLYGIFRQGNIGRAIEAPALVPVTNARKLLADDFPLKFPL